MLQPTQYPTTKSLFATIVGRKATLHLIVLTKNGTNPHIPPTNLWQKVEQQFQPTIARQMMMLWFVPLESLTTLTIRKTS